jgi:glutamine synthetase
MGADGNIALPLTLVQAAMAESMNVMSERLEKGETLRDVTASFFEEHKRIIFNGNGYSKEWHQEAVARGLPNLRTSLQAYPVLKAPKARELLQKMEIFQPHEIDARVSVAMDTHVETIMIEANVMLDMLETGVIPACAKDLQTYSGEAAKLAGVRAQVYASVGEKTRALSDAIDALPQGDTEQAAQYVQDVIRPKMAEVRVVADEAERLIQSALYPFPTYHEMFYRPQNETVDKEF